MIVPPLPWTGQDLIAATGGQWVCGDAGLGFSGIGIDSRTLGAQQVFVAIRGETHDGHRFVPRVVAAGARGLIVARSRLDALPIDTWREAGVFCLAVDDTLDALARLARFHRDRHPARVVAITGSNGKTTTRALTAGVLSRRYPVVATRGNFNNAVGLPLSLFALTPAHRWAVFEIGMNRPGEIDRLAWICRPDLGVITNIGPAHLEGLGTLDAVRDAKGELLERLGPSGVAVLNADDPRVMQLAARTARSILFGTSTAAAVRAEKIVTETGGLRFDLVLPEKRASVRLPMAAPFMVSNALAAAAVGWHAGLAIEEIGAALEAFQAVPGRLVRVETDRGITLIDDTYNANPASVAAALEALAVQRQGGGHRTALVLGDMRELGPTAPALHHQVGEQAAASGIDRLWITGEMAAEVAAGARKAGMPDDRIRWADKEEIVAELAQWLLPGDLVLVKGSRAMAMETVVTALKKRLQG